MVVISPLPNLSNTKDAFTSSKINEEFKKDLILEKPGGRLPDDHWASGIIDRFQRWGKSFEGSLIDSLKKEGFNFTVEDLNWLLASGIIPREGKKSLFLAYQDPSKEPSAISSITGSTYLYYLPKEKSDGTKLSGKELAMLWESGKVIYPSDTSQISSLFETFSGKLSVEEIYERKEAFAAYISKSEKCFSCLKDFTKANDYLPSDPVKYKKALDIFIKQGPEKDSTENYVPLLAQAITKLIEKYPSLSVEQISEKLYTATDDGLNKSKVFHTNAPEAIYNRTGILLSSRGDKGRSQMDNTPITMPDLNFANEDFQISGHHIFRGFQEKTYLVYVAHNQSSDNANIKIKNGGIGLTSESHFSNTHQGAKVYDTSDGNFTVGPGDKAANAVLDGKTDSRILTNQGEINIPPNSTKIITAIATNGHDGVTANINGHINGSVKMTAAVITASEIQRYGSIENAVNHHLRQGDFLAQKHHGPIGRGHGIYEGSEYNINKNLFLTDQAVSPDPKENILAESIIASTKYYGEEQSGKVLKGNNGKEALLEGYSSDDGNIGSYNTLYKLNYKIHNLASDEKKHKIKVNFASLAKGGRRDQAAFRGNIVLELKDTEGRIIQRIKRQVSIGFNEEVTAFNDVQIDSNVNSAEIKMVNTADSTPPYKISVLKT
jgi:hypothetical protein